MKPRAKALLLLMTLQLCASGAWAKDVPEDVLVGLRLVEDRLAAIDVILEPTEARMYDAVLLKNADYVNHAHEVAAAYGERFGLALQMYNTLDAFDGDRSDPIHGEGYDMLDNAIDRLKTVATEWPHTARLLEHLLRREGPSEDALDYARLCRQQGTGPLLSTLFGVGAAASLYTFQYSDLPWWSTMGIAGVNVVAAVYSLFHFQRRFPLSSDDLNRTAESHFFFGARNGGVALPGAAINSPQWVANTWQNIVKSRCEEGLKP
jgi:hypothetical protein